MRNKKRTIDEKIQEIRNRISKLEELIKDDEERQNWSSYWDHKKEVEVYQRAIRYAQFYLSLPHPKRIKAHKVLNKALM